MKKVLHILTQRPSLTGSGITLDSLVRLASQSGWRTAAVVGVPSHDPDPKVGGLPADKIYPLFFRQGDLDFPVPGMSDVMPYRSTRFAAMTEKQLAAYRTAWRNHLAGVIEAFEPTVIHANHVWIVSSMIKTIAPEIPLVVQCHATGLRQMKLCPHLADEVRTGCQRADAFVVLHGGHADDLSGDLQVPAKKIHLVGSGIREDLFHAQGRAGSAGNRLLYVGKFSHAKGLPWLLDAVERLRKTSRPDLVLEVAGGGSGAEADALAQRMKALSPSVRVRGFLKQPALAELMRTCDVCVLPSFYEGVPLVLAEAFACGCSLVATKLPGVIDRIAPAFGQVLEQVDMPRLTGIDTPLKDDLPAFTDNLSAAIEKALDYSISSHDAVEREKALAPFTWKAVFTRVEKVWGSVI